MAAIKESKVKPVFTARNSRAELGVMGCGLLAMYILVPEFKEIPVKAQAILITMFIAYAALMELRYKG